MLSPHAGAEMQLKGEKYPAPGGNTARRFFMPVTFVHYPACSALHAACAAGACHIAAFSVSARAVSFTSVSALYKNRISVIE